MNFSTIIALVIGLGSLVGGFLMEGGKLAGLISPTSAIIIFGGTAGALGVAFPMKEIKKLPKILKVVLTYKQPDLVQLIIFLKDLSLKTRKNGLLSLESEITSNDLNPLAKKGLQLVVDGIDPQTIKAILELESEATSDRHHKGIGIFEAAGGFSPTMGIIGTVLGLVHVLSNLSEPETLGEKIATAFIATLYGVGIANVLFLPLGNKLKVLNEYEEVESTLIIEAVLLIQTGTNPSTLVEKLKGFLNKTEVAKLEELNKGAE